MDNQILFDLFSKTIGAAAILGRDAALMTEFELDFTWQNGAVSELVIRSALGGNARIRVPNELTSNAGDPLPVATGDNPNSYFDTAQVKPPIISPAADLNEVILAPTFVFDLATEAGRSYRLVAKQ